VPAVVAPQPPEAMAVFEAKAAELKAPLHRFGREWHAAEAGDGMLFRDSAGERRFPKPALPGAHQIPNAGAALACLPLLKGFAIDDKAASRGLRGVEWPARLQRLTRGPLVESVPAGWELWLDGGHNQAAGEALGEFVKGWADRPLHLVFGMLSSKEPVAFLKPLAPLAQDLIAVRIAGDHASLPAETAAEAARTAGLKAETGESVEAAVARILAREPRPSRILVCGSLYLAGVVLERNG
jgi:dihydrofolate synthase/folylpolyglutamate synthase